MARLISSRSAARSSRGRRLFLEQLRPFCPVAAGIISLSIVRMRSRNSSIERLLYKMPRLGLAVA